MCTVVPMSSRVRPLRIASVISEIISLANGAQDVGADDPASGAREDL